MGIVFRQSVKTTIVTFSGAALGALIQFIFVYILPLRELGFYRTSLSIGAILQLFVMMGMGSVLAVFIQKYPEGDERRKTLVTLSVIISAIAILIYTTGFVFFKNSFVQLYAVQDRALLEKYYYYIPILVSLWGFMSLFDLYLASQVRIAFSAFVREVLLRICNLGIIALFYYKLIDFHYFIVLSMLVYAIPAIILFIASTRTKGFGFSLNFKVFSREEYKEIIHFAWYHLLYGLSLNLFGYLDTIMLGQLDVSGLESVAVYGIAIFVISVMVIPYRAMASSAFPILNKAYIDNDTVHLDDLFKRSGVNILIVGLALFALIFCNLDNLVTILPEKYALIKPILTILMIGKIVDMSTGLNNELISISKYYKFNFRTSVLLVAAVFLFYRTLIPGYGVYGAAWGTTLAFTIINVVKMLFLWYKMRLQPFTTGSFKVFLATVPAIIAGYALPYLGNPYLDAICRSIIIMVVYGALLLLVKPSEDLQKYLSSIRDNKKLF